MNKTFGCRGYTKEDLDEIGSLLDEDFNPGGKDSLINLATYLHQFCKIEYGRFNRDDESFPVVESDLFIRASDLLKDVMDRIEYGFAIYQNAIAEHD